MRPRVLSSSSIAKDRVKNSAGEDLGAVKELMVNIRTGHVEYVVVAFGGFFGLGAKFFAIPFDCFTIDLDEKCLRLDVTKETLESVEGFDDDDWPDFADERWRSRTRTAFAPARTPI